MSIVDMLSQKIAEGVPPSRKSSRAVMNQRNCFTAFDKAMYSASAVLVATDFCFWDFHEIAQFPNLKMYPETERQVSRQLP